MTTATTNTPIDHTTDAGFRAWGSELSGMLATVGLVQTADTGQIDWATVLRPAANTTAGYEVWRFDDSLQATAPVFLKIEYGTNNTTTTPGMWLTVAVGSDGSGGLTGLISTRTSLRPGQSASGGVPSAGSWPSYACHAEGFFGFAFKCGSISMSGGAGSVAGVFVSRPMSTDGSLTTDGVGVVTIGLQSSLPAMVQCLGFDSFTAYPAAAYSKAVAMVPVDAATTAIAADFQVIRNLGYFPAFRTLCGVFTYLDAEISQGATVAVALDGSSQRTYIALGSYAAFASLNLIGTHRHAMLWE